MANDTTRTVRVRFDGTVDGLRRATRQAERTVSQFNARVSGSLAPAVKGLGLLGAAGSAAGVLVAAGLATAATGFVALGALAVKSNEQVQSAFTGLKDHVQEELSTLAAPFVPALTKAADQLRARWRDPHRAREQHHPQRADGLCRPPGRGRVPQRGFL